MILLYIVTLSKQTHEVDACGAHKVHVEAVMGL